MVQVQCIFRTSNPRRLKPSQADSRNCQIKIQVNNIYKNLAPGPGAYNTTFTEFGGLHDYNKTHKSFDGRAIKTNNDSVKRSNFFNTNANENNKFNTTSLKNDLMDFNKITNENKRNLPDDDVRTELIFLLK